MKKNFNSANRFFNSIELLPYNWIRKMSKYNTKFDDEIKWFLCLPPSIYRFVPTVKNIDLTSKHHSITYKYITFPTLHSLLVGTNVKDSSFWKIVPKQYYCFIKECQKIKPNKFNEKYWQNNLTEMYVNKTIARLNDILSNPKLGSWFEKHFVYINGIKYPSVFTILNYIKSSQFKKDLTLKDLTILSPQKKYICFMHGDLVFSNVFIYKNIKNKFEFKTIDPRGSFGKDKNFGDIIYDYAKIYQSVYGDYDLILEDSFKFWQHNENKFSFQIKDTVNSKLCKIAFLKFFPKKILNKIRLLESLQFLSMVPLHNDRPNHQNAFLCQGIIRFCEVMNKKWK